MAALKYSRQREAIKNFLMTRTDHPTADVIYENIRMVYPNISLGTVYRNLSLLADIGEIQKLPNFAGADHFDGRTDMHCHFLCKNCSKIIDLDHTGLEQFIQTTKEHFSGVISSCNTNFSGLCEDCMKLSSESANMLDK
ncbi:MAG: transcriptional repressor [Blautia sp.]|nr:transcriptional repressor [Blautia sp.]MDY5031311.1 transcriptional repressor [Blautia sp.]